jgi:hypothetical protein
MVAFAYSAFNPERRLIKWFQPNNDILKLFPVVFYKDICADLSAVIYIEDLNSNLKLQTPFNRLVG